MTNGIETADPLQKDSLISRAFLVGCKGRGETVRQVMEYLDELAALVDTAGAEQVGQVLFDLSRITAGTYIGTGQLEKLTERVKETEANLIVFDAELSPTQQRNIESVAEVMVMDRTGIILDIFATRAQTKEGKLQVELAQLQYLLPRLRGMWTHLSRQGAGIGTRGPGETELESDRRRINHRIARVKRELIKVKQTRALHRSARLNVPYSTAVLVGYTNAGKSTLMNRLTGADVLVEDKLFATLDPTVRELRMSDGDRVLISDTVGFIRKLPHQLVESFAATFEQIALADLMIHMVDASHPQVEDHIDTTLSVLREIGVEPDRTLMVLNKSDNIEETAVRTYLERKFPDAIFASAITGDGLDALLAEISLRMSAGQERMELLVPYTDKDALRKIQTQAKILEEKYEAEGVHMTIKARGQLAHQLRNYAR